MKILIGTKNPYKAGSMEYMLKSIEGVQIYLLKDTDIDVDVEENGTTLAENAQKKAIEISKHTDMYVLTSDGGVDIPGLGDKWDMLRNQRIVGHDNDDRVKANKVLELMEGLEEGDRKVEYHLALALARNGKIVGTVEDITDWGYIVEEMPKGELAYGEWMSHIWYYPKFNKTLTQIEGKELEEVNMRSNGLGDKLRDLLKAL